MGQGGPKEDETHEITIELEGSVSPEAFEEYVRQLRECLKELARLTDKGKGGQPLKVRQVRSEIKRLQRRK